MWAPSLAAKGRARLPTPRAKPLVLVLFVFGLLSTAGACTPVAINEGHITVGTTNSAARDVQLAFAPDTCFHVSCEKVTSAFVALLVALSQIMVAGATFVDVTKWFSTATHDEFVCLVRCRRVGRRRCKDPRVGWKRRLHDRIRCMEILQRKPDCTPLHLMFRGGGGGANASKGKDVQSRDERLLSGLEVLLSSIKEDKGGKVRHGKGAPDQPDEYEDGLVRATERALERSRRDPSTLLQRLESLVAAAKKGVGFGRRKKRRKNDADPEEGVDAQPEQRSAKAQCVQHPSGDNVRGKNGAKGPQHDKGKGKGKGKSKQEASPAPQPLTPDLPDGSWAQRLLSSEGIGQGQKGKGADMNIGKGKGKGKGKYPLGTEGKGQDPHYAGPHVTSISLLKHAYGEGAIHSVADAKTALEAGRTPAGSAVLCSESAYEDLLRLAKLHQITGAKVALLLPQTPKPDKPEGDQPPESTAMLLPTWEGGRPSLRKFWVKALCQELPVLPQQQFAQTKVKVDEAPLVVFRATLVQSLCTKDKWEAFKRNPASQVFLTFGNKVVHSTYGWKEATVGARKGPPDVILQGFVRVKLANQPKVLDHLSEDGLFIEYLACDDKPKPVVYWIPPMDGEEPREYLARVCKDAKSERATVAHRRGGGVYLGLRVPKGTHKPQVHAWSLTGAPGNWDAQDVLRCLFEAGVEEVEVIKPPGKKKGWLIKGIVKDVSAIGVVAIQAEQHTMLLTRAQHKVDRKVEKVSLIKGPDKSFNEPLAKRVLLPSTPQKAANKANDGVKDDKEDKRERSPRRDKSQEQPIKMPYAEKYDALDCGGRGDCGYLCIAAALGFDRNEKWESMKPELAARARTVRNDIYKHVSSARHEGSYKPFFEANAVGGTAEQEAGPVPTNWDAWKEATLRPGRWIDGLSILAASKRYGICILVIPRSGDPKDRPMRFGEWRSGKDPVVLLLKDGHYQLARLKPGKRWPQEWLQAEPAEVNHAMMRAGGLKNKDVCHLNTPVKRRRVASDEEGDAPWRPPNTPTSSWRVPGTPNTVKVSPSKPKGWKDTWRLECTPLSTAARGRGSSSKSRSTWRPLSTPTPRDKMCKTRLHGALVLINGVPVALLPRGVVVVAVVALSIRNPMTIRLRSRARGKTISLGSAPRANKFLKVTLKPMLTVGSEVIVRPVILMFLGRVTSPVPSLRWSKPARIYPKTRSIGSALFALQPCPSRRSDLGRGQYNIIAFLRTLRLILGLGFPVWPANGLKGRRKEPTLPPPANFVESKLGRRSLRLIRLLRSQLSTPRPFNFVRCPSSGAFHA